MNAETHTHVHRQVELKDCTRHNKPESFLYFIIKQALISLEVQGFRHMSECKSYPEDLSLSGCKKYVTNNITNLCKKMEECGNSLKEEIEFAVDYWSLMCRRGTEDLGVAQCGSYGPHLAS